MSVTLLTDVDAVRRMIGDASVDELQRNYADATLEELVEQASAFVFAYTGATAAALTTTNDDDEVVTRADVKRATTALVAFWLRNENTPGGQGLQSEQSRTGAGYVMPTSTLQLLANYRVVGFGADPAVLVECEDV